jgi:hypothetical protein
MRGFDTGWKQVANIVDDCRLIKQKLRNSPVTEKPDLLNTTVRLYATAVDASFVSVECCFMSRPASASRFPPPASRE